MKQQKIRNSHFLLRTPTRRTSKRSTAFKLASLVAFLYSGISFANDIVISGVVDGPLTGGVPKAVQLYVKNDIADLSQCGIGSANNGGGSDGQEFTFPAGSASAGDYLYIASESTYFSQFFGFSPNFVHSSANINGDDAIELLCDNTVVDTFGDINTDGTGQAWEYLDGWASRKEDTGPDGTSFEISSWVFSGKNALDGESTNASASNPFPLNGEAGDTGDTGDNGSDDGSNSPSVCFNCPALDTIADASTFDDASYYVNAIFAVANDYSGTEIKSAVTNAISENHKNLTYSEVWTALTETDEDTANSDNVILFYKGTSLAKLSNGSGEQSSNPDNWNREHVWAKSHGFPSTSQEGYTDIHHLRPTDISVNASRGNLDFDNSDNALAESPINRVDGDSFEPRDEVKGDVARMVFYMDTRYEGSGSDSTPDLSVVDRLTSTGEAALGRLCRLLEWHNGDPVSSFEQNRNNVIYEYQGNRNPYIDHPEWVSAIYGSQTCTGNDDNNGGDSGGDGSGNGSGGNGDSGSAVALIISEYIEGSSNNKAIELYNLTNSSINLDEEQVKLARYSNGGTSPSYINLSGTIEANSTYVVAHSSAVDALKALADQTSGSLSHNGDDAYVLFHDDVVIDSFGRVGEDPGSYWGSDTFKTQNNTLVRNNSVANGDNIFDDNFEPSDQWTGSSIDDYSNLGAHSVIQPNLLISEYIEGSSNNKAIELYNPSNTDIDLAEDNYQLARFSNGSTSASTADLSGLVPAKGVYVFANASAATEIKDKANELLGLISHNGDDAYVLYKNGEVIDSFGRVGEDPGSEWGTGLQSTKDNTLTRRSSVTSGDTVIDDLFNPATEWEGFDNNTFQYLGSHNEASESDQGDTAVIGVCDAPASLISVIQGSGESSLLVNETHVIEAVVTANFPHLNGFFVQEEAKDADANNNTSEAIFVSASEQPAAGKLVRVIGNISESFGKTQITASASIMECGEAAIASTDLQLPFDTALSAEGLEGMYVSVNSPLTVTNTYNLGKFGELSLSNGLMYIPTNLHTPNSQEAIELAEENARNVVLLDDISNDIYPETVAFPNGVLTADNTVRLGDQVTVSGGILDYSYGNYRILPTQTPSFTSANPRQTKPSIIEGNLKVASMNVLNLFNGDGLGGGFPTARGADTAEEFERQIVKTVNAILAIDADIVGLMEIENDGDETKSTLAELVTRLNAKTAEDTYSFVETNGKIGTDAIAVAFFYKTSSVALKGDAQVNTNAIFNRPALAQTFTLQSNEQPITVVVNHFKSKGGCRSASGLDLDQGDGQACFNAKRVAQSTELINWLNTDPQLSQVNDVLIIGDLNAYAKEDPITQLTSNGFVNLIEKMGGEGAYSYSYAGEVGYLDHALASSSLADKVVDAIEWHINADEPAYLDYNVENKSQQQLIELYNESPFRMSDHDPVVVTFNLSVAAMKGDWDGDSDVDRNDVQGLMRAIQSREPIDNAFDLNNDSVINILDARTMMSLCSRPYCAL